MRDSRSLGAALQRLQRRCGSKGGVRVVYWKNSADRLSAAVQEFADATHAFVAGDDVLDGVDDRGRDLSKREGENVDVAASVMVFAVLGAAHLATGTVRDDRSQQSMWVATADLPQSAGHPFYERLTGILEAAAFGHCFRH